MPFGLVSEEMSLMKVVTKLRLAREGSWGLDTHRPTSPRSNVRVSQARQILSVTFQSACSISVVFNVVGPHTAPQSGLRSAQVRDGFDQEAVSKQ